MLDTPEQVARFLAALDYSGSDIEATVHEQFPRAKGVRGIVDAALAQRARSVAQTDQTIATHRDAIESEHHVEGDA